MRSVCALNFEAMSILDPAEQSSAAAMMQKELEKQVQHAMEDDTASQVSFNLSENGGRQENDAEREMMNMALNMQQERMDANSRKIESKESMWKPAPIIGREAGMQMS